LKSFHPFSIVLIFCLGTLVYSNTFFSSFHFDDHRFIINNFAIRNIQDLQDIWRFYPCRFVAFLSLALNYHFNGLNVFAYHLFNLAVHLVSAISVWWLTLLTLSTPAMKEDKITRHAGFIALFAGLVFVSHPLQTEAVTYIWQRTATMAAMFYLVSLCLYVKSRLPCQPPGLTRFYYLCSLLTAIVAMFTKETAITLPLIILLYEFMFIGGKGNLNWKPVIPFLFTIFIIPWTLLLAHSEKVPYVQGSVEEHGGISRMQYILTQLRVTVTYIRLVFLPFNQNLDYDYPVFKKIFEIPVFISFLILMAILFWAKQMFSKYRLISFSIFWFFLTLLPESAPFPLKDVIFEHRLYLPLVGSSIFLVSSAYYLWRDNAVQKLMVALTLIVACYSVMTYQRNKVWKDELTLWDDTVQKSPHKARPYHNRGTAYERQGNLTQAIFDFSKVIEINPNYAQVYKDRAVLYYKLRVYDKAWGDVHKAEGLGQVVDPQFINALNVVSGRER